MSNKIQLYLDYISQPARTVLAFCLLSAIPIDIKEIRIAKLQHLSQEYEKINPMKKVPAIFDPENGLSLGQSHAIVNYLMRKYKLGDKWGLKDESQSAKIDQYLHYHHQNTRKCAGILYTQVFSRLYPVEQSEALKATSPRKDVQGILDFIQEHYFKDSHFMVGKNLTVADLAAYFEIQSLLVVDYDFSKWKKIVVWMSKIQEIKEIQQTNNNFMKMLPKMKLPPSKL